MSFDDLVLSLQRAADRVVRRLRRGEAPAVMQRRLLIVQIDGLSRGVFERAMASGHTPFLGSLLRRHGYRLEPMTVGLPTSTPAFQMAMLYGVRPDIPGFHYYDRDRRSDVHFPRPGHAAYVEGKLAAGRRGILRGGSAYGCVFTGDADNNLFTFATLTQPSGRGALAASSPFFVLAWVCAKSAVLTVVELAKVVARLGMRPLRDRRGRRWLMIKIAISVWVRGFFTMAAARDVYAGIPAVYVNYVDYDEAAHAFGPRSRAALVSLRRVDAAIRQVWRAVRRVPEHRYDVYVLADHGQTPCKPYQSLTGGQRFERWIFDQLLQPWVGADTPEQHVGTGLVRGIRKRTRESTGLAQLFLNYLGEEYVRESDPEAHEQGGIRVIAAGPNAFLYVLDGGRPLDADALAARFPGLAEKLSASPGVAFVLARSATGPVCFWQGKRHHLTESGDGPFADRADRTLVVQGIADLLRMPSAGDFVIYGTGVASDRVSFLPEWGAHAGPSWDEMHTFIVHAATVAVPASITHPVQLYEHFIRYQTTWRS